MEWLKLADLSGLVVEGGGQSGSSGYLPESLPQRRALKMKPKRFTPDEIEQHLQNIYLFSDLGGSSSGATAGSSSSSGGGPGTTSSDSVAQLGPVLRAINASEQQGAFLRQLKEFMGGKEREIEVVCKDNYQARNARIQNTHATESKTC